MNRKTDTGQEDYDAVAGNAEYTSNGKTENGARRRVKARSRVSRDRTVLMQMQKFEIIAD